MANDPAKWERLSTDVCRIQAPGGWVYRTIYMNIASTVFVPAVRGNVRFNCSFCGAPHTDVKNLVAEIARNVSICDKCAKKCVAIMEADK